jgi:hypothetical protein
MASSSKREIGDIYDEATPEPSNVKRVRTRMQTRLAAASVNTTTLDASHSGTGDVDLTTNSEDTAASSVVDARSSTTLDEKPLAVHTPPVWSYNRGALGDATEYMKRHEGGNHYKDGVTLGLLIDSNVTPRDCMDGTVIITSM